MVTAQKRRRRPCKGCRGAKVVPGVDRNAAAALFNRRKKACRACDDTAGCFIAHQTPCSQRTTDYNAASDVTEYIDENGSESDYTYDAIGRLTKN